ncbi:MAG: hypothetical protein MJ095_09240 [Oscillospiraceae bacterium]|nr:hypothetical protein [Oscillospiraceae bacterium]
MKLLKKLAPVYGGFIAAVILIYSRFGLHLINGNPLRTLAGIIIMILLIVLVIFLTLTFIRNEQINSLPVIETTAKVSEEDRLSDFTMFYGSLRNRNLGPFENRKADFFEICRSMKTKNDNLQKLLRESFSPEDLTFNTYVSTLNEVMKIFNNNLNGIKKRLEVFDYVEWSSNREDEHAVAYISEVESLYEKNHVVIDHIDDLLHELVLLDDISDVPLEKINLLIEQTQNYKKITERQ